MKNDRFEALAAKWRRPHLSPLTERGWLAEQSAELQDWLAQAGRWRRYAARQVLYDAGDAPDALYGLAEGASRSPCRWSPTSR